ncbi:MAG: hypothetical protein IT383_03715 [Deltaproteobacteria bacterium]|nr:hypothetical protein [Deltaproteobacteria bacterium]
MRALALFLVLASTTAAADAGELYLGAGGSLEAAWLRHPLAKDDNSIELSANPVTMLPRLVTSARYGITNELHLGLGLEAAPGANVVTSDVKGAGTSGQIVTGSYLELAAPLATTWRFDSGYDVTGAVDLEAGPVLALWSTSALVDPLRLDEKGRPVRLPFDVDDQVQVGALIRMAAMVEWRVFNNLALRAGPAVTVSWAGTPAVHAALVIEPTFVTAVGGH